MSRCLPFNCPETKARKTAYWWIMARDEVVLYLPFTPDECARRLAGQVAQGIAGLFEGFSGKPFTGSVSATDLTLFRSTVYRNSFKPGFYAWLEVGSHHGQTGTLIHGRVQMSVFTTVFMVIWFSGVCLGALASLPLLWQSGSNGASWSALIPLGMLLFGVALVKFGAWMNRADGEIIQDFLRRALDARAVDPPPSQPVVTPTR